MAVEEQDIAPGRHIAVHMSRLALSPFQAVELAASIRQYGTHGQFPLGLAHIHQSRTRAPFTPHPITLHRRRIADGLIPIALGRIRVAHQKHVTDHPVPAARQPFRDISADGFFGGELPDIRVDDPFDVNDTPVNSFEGIMGDVYFWNDAATVVPEPSTYAGLFGLAALLMVLARRKRMIGRLRRN